MGNWRIRVFGVWGFEDWEIGELGIRGLGKGYWLGTRYICAPHGISSLAEICFVKSASFEHGLFLCALLAYSDRDKISGYNRGTRAR